MRPVRRKIARVAASAAAAAAATVAVAAAAVVSAAAAAAVGAIAIAATVVTKSPTFQRNGFSRDGAPEELRPFSFWGLEPRPRLPASPFWAQRRIRRGLGAPATASSVQLDSSLRSE